MSGAATARVRKAYVRTADGAVHYRTAGSGPPVVLLHDSPRSSLMHEQLIRELAPRFTVIATDTPGYGSSTPLPQEPRPGIPEFAAALARTLDALGIERCPVYGFHTSSKINLQFAIEHPQRAALTIMDGLNLPPGGPDEGFITRYMKPYVVHDDGSHLAATWARARDLHRFFPWFERAPAARLDLDLPDERALHGYVLDMLSSGVHYSVAYSAAMRFLALPLVGRIAGPAVFMCRRTDPLYAYLDALPADLPPGCRIERLPGDRESWRACLEALFERGAVGTQGPRLPDPLDDPTHLPVRGYVDVAQGQIHLERHGGGAGRPLLLLPESPGSARSVAALAAQLGRDRAAYAVDLPGQGGSDALPTPDLAGYAAALLACLERLGLGSVDLVAEFTAVPLALELARIAGARVHALVLDGPMPFTAAERGRLARSYCPPLEPRWDGTHLTTLWHRLRDQELAWPWFDRTRAGIRHRVVDLGGDSLQARVLDVARQLESYGDAAAIAFEREAPLAGGGRGRAVLVLEDAGDVRYASAREFAGQLAGAEVAARAPLAAERALTILAFLDRHA